MSAEATTNTQQLTVHEETYGYQCNKLSLYHNDQSYSSSWLAAVAYDISDKLNLYHNDQSYSSPWLAAVACHIHS